MLLSRVKSTAIVLLLILAVAPVWAADLQRGLDAYQRGDYANALAQFEPLAEEGDPVAQFSLGVMYDNGEGVVQDYQQAFNWFRKAAEQGHARAQGHLGRMYFLGRGTEEDLVQAYIWFNLAVTQGDDRFGLSQKSRKLAEEKMTAAELEQAQEQSWDYMAKYVEPFRQADTEATTSPPVTASTEITEPDTAESDATSNLLSGAEPPAVAASEPAEQPSTAATTPSSIPISTPAPRTNNSVATVANTTPLAIPALQSPEPVTAPGTVEIATNAVSGRPVDTAPEPDTTTAETNNTTAPTTISSTPLKPVQPPVTTATLSQPATIQAPPQPSSSATMPSLPSSPFPQTTASASANEDAGQSTDGQSTDGQSTGENPPQTAAVKRPDPAPARPRARIKGPVQPSPSGRFRVQLASMSSGEKASAEEQRLQRRHPQLLGKLEFTVQSAELDKGVFHRVQAGPLTYSQANSLCGELKRNNQPCLVVNR